MTLPPGPRYLGSLGAIAMQRDPLGFLQRCRARHGDVFTLSFGTALRRTVWVCDPALVEQILAEPAELLEAGTANAILRPLVGDGSTLLLAGEQHAQRRTLLWPEFDHARLAVDRELILALASSALAAWRPGEEIPLWRWTRRVTMQTMLGVVFGSDRAGRREELAQRLADIVELSGSAAMLVARLRVDGGRFSPWGRFLRHRARLDELLYAEIAARRADRTLASRRDVISMFVQARYPDGRRLSDREVRDELMTLVIAGNHTTAGGLAWAVELLLRHPVELARVRAELDGDGEYLGAAIDEALRLRTPLFGIGRAAVVDYRLGRFTIPPGVGIAVPLLLVYRSPMLFEDPALYRPSRWLRASGPHPSWLPFGGGIRSCIGERFARMQIGVLLGEILRCAELELVDPRPERLQLKAGALVVPDREVRVTVAARRAGRLQQAADASAASPAGPGSR